MVVNPSIIKPNAASAAELRLSRRVDASTDGLRLAEIHSGSRDWRQLASWDQMAIGCNETGGVKLSVMPYKILSLLVSLEIPIVVTAEHDGRQFSGLRKHADFPCCFCFEGIRNGGCDCTREALVAIGIHQGEGHRIRRLFHDRPWPRIIAHSSAMESVSAIVFVLDDLEFFSQGLRRPLKSGW